MIGVCGNNICRSSEVRFALTTKHCIYVACGGQLTLINQISRTEGFAHWLHCLRDPLGKATILRRIERAQKGNFGDARDLGEGVAEMKIHVGPGYRVYYAREDTAVYILLAGGTKHNQQGDIDCAKAMWKTLREKIR